jgi:GntR family transcriptional regulator
MYQLKLDPQSATPLHEQLKQSILIEIISGKLKDGDALPSIRSLAKFLKLNPNTVAKVYYNLEEEGFIEGKPGSGYTVRQINTKLDKLKISIIEQDFKDFLSKALYLGFKKAEIKELTGRYLNHE